MTLAVLMSPCNWRRRRFNFRRILRTEMPACSVWRSRRRRTAEANDGTCSRAPNLRQSTVLSITPIRMRCRSSRGDVILLTTLPEFRLVRFSSVHLPHTYRCGITPRAGCDFTKQKIKLTHADHATSFEIQVACMTLRYERGILATG